MVVLIALSVLATAAVAFDRDTPVFFCPDAAMKLHMAENIGRFGYSAAAAPQPNASVQALWDAGLFPVTGQYLGHIDGEPWYTFPLPFPALLQAITSLGGWKSAVLPALFGLWCMLALVGRASVRALGWSGWALVPVAFASLASLVVPYATDVWEHSLAVALVLFGVTAHPSLLAGALPEEDATPNRRLPVFVLAGGLIAGFGVFLRPEVAVVAACLGIAAAVDRRVAWRLRVLWGGGAALAIAGWFVHNLIVYGQPLGLHAEQVLVAGAPTSLGWHAAAERGAEMGALWLVHGVEFWMLLVLAACLMAPGLGGRHERVLTWGALGLSVVAAVGISFIVPNAGGLQYGPRYLLVTLPLLWVGIIAGFAAVRHHRSLRVIPACAAVGLIGWGAFINGATGLQTFHARHYGEYRALVRAIDSLQPDFIAVGQQHIAVETASLWSTIPYVRALGTDDLAQIAEGLRANVPYTLLWIVENRNVPDVERFAVPFTDGALQCVRLPPVGPSHVSFRCDSVARRDAPTAP